MTGLSRKISGSSEIRKIPMKQALFVVASPIDRLNRRSNRDTQSLIEGSRFRNLLENKVNPDKSRIVLKI